MRGRKKQSGDSGGISAILAELKLLLEAFDDEETTEIEFRLAGLTTMFIKAGLSSQKRMTRLKFHAAIQVMTVKVPNRGELSDEMRTFEDLVNSYGDEPSAEDLAEAKEILASVVGQLTAALHQTAGKQLGLNL